MPDAPARPPGSRRRGCSRPPRTGRTARSHRSATRRPHPADPVRSRHAGPLRPAPRTGTSCFAGRGTCTRQEPLAQSLQGQRAGPAGPAPVQRVRGQVRNTSPGKVLFRGCSGASSLTSSKMPASRASPSSRAWRAVTVSSGVGRFLAGISRRYGRTTGHPDACTPMLAAGRCSAVTPPARHAASSPYGLDDARDRLIETSGRRCGLAGMAKRCYIGCQSLTCPCSNGYIGDARLDEMDSLIRRRRTARRSRVSSCARASISR